MKNGFLAMAILFVLSVLPAAAQKKPGRLTYSAAEKKCNAALDKKTWKTAEAVCKNALTLAQKLSDDKKAEKMRAFENYGFALFAQEKFQPALDNWTQAYEIGKTFLTESDSDLAYACFNLGRANHGLARLDQAIEYYQKAEQIYRAAYQKAADAETKTKLKASIRKTLVLQQYIAFFVRGDEAKYKELEKKKEDLEKP